MVLDLQVGGVYCEKYDAVTYGCTIPGSAVAVATKICGSSAWNVLRFTLVMPRILTGCEIFGRFVYPRCNIFQKTKEPIWTALTDRRTDLGATLTTFSVWALIVRVTLRLIKKIFACC